MAVPCKLVLFNFFYNCSLYFPLPILILILLGLHTALNNFAFRIHSFLIQSHVANFRRKMLVRTIRPRFIVRAIGTTVTKKCAKTEMSVPICQVTRCHNIYIYCHEHLRSSCLFSVILSHVTMTDKYAGN